MVGWFNTNPIILDDISAGLYTISRLGTITIDHALLTSLVEQRRQETHTFYLPVGEATIILQDLIILLGLHIDGRAVVSPVMNDDV